MTAPATASLDVRDAYRQCEQITRTQAKNFSYGIALLPASKRRALSAVYAFARRIDDIGDGPLPASDKLTQLERARADAAALDKGGGAGSDVVAADPVLAALADAAGRFTIPLGAFGELIDGCEADVRGTTYATFADLEHYCRCVAGSIGRLSLGVFGSTDPERAESLADSLGVALQLTNILRDIREDLGSGRVYLPAEDLERFGAAMTPGGEDGEGTMTGDLAGLITFEADRARSWYATGMQLMPLLDRRSAASAGAMAGIYRRLLEHIIASPQEALRRRMSLSAGEKARVAAVALLGMARPAGAARRSGPGAGSGERS